MPGVDTAQQYIIELQEELSKEGEALQNEFKENMSNIPKCRQLILLLL